MWKIRIWALFLLIAGGFIGYFIYASTPALHPNKTVRFQTDSFPFKLGLDLSGGVQLIYKAEVDSIKPADVGDAMASLRDTVERRINVFGVAEPIIQTEVKGSDQRLIVQLPGVTDVKKAVDIIGQTPKLEFMTERPQAEIDAYNAAVQKLKDEQAAGKTIAAKDIPQVVLDGIYQPTELNGRFLQHATLEFDSSKNNEPVVSLLFDQQGTDLFAQMTKDNVGKTIAIFLDRDLGNTEPISAPVVKEPILNGEAIISGNFTAEDARTLVTRLNSGALPVDKLDLLSTDTISAPLGAKALQAGVLAGVYGLIIVALFLILWYRLPGLVATVALTIYVLMMLALFKFFNITLTAAGIAGFILTIGMAVDANILIFERTKEELRKGHAVHEAIHEGFARAWTSIRDSNISSLIMAAILFYFGTTLIKGFALVFGLGVLVSMFSAITISRAFLLSLPFKGHSSFVKGLFGSGFFKIH